MWHLTLAIAHALTFHSWWAYNLVENTRTSKQKRGWAFIQDGPIFARAQYAQFWGDRNSLYSHTKYKTTHNSMKEALVCKLYHKSNPRERGSIYNTTHSLNIFLMKMYFWEYAIKQAKPIYLTPNSSSLAQAKPKLRNHSGRGVTSNEAESCTIELQVS